MDRCLDVNEQQLLRYVSFPPPVRNSSILADFGKQIMWISEQVISETEYLQQRMLELHFPSGN